MSELKVYLAPCLLIIDQILSVQKRLKNKWLVNLHSTRLNQLVGGDRKRITAIHLLHELGLIEINHKYCFNHKLKKFSKSYKIADKYDGDIVEIETGCITPISHSPQTKGVLNTTLVHLKDKTQGNPQLIHPEFIQYQQNNTEWLSINDTTNRVFTSINSLPKEDRKHLKDSFGNYLIEVDFSSSHLQHLIKVIRDDIRSGAYQPFHSVEYFSEEVVAFKTAVLGSDFYFDLAKAYRTETNINCDRAKAKRYVMYWLSTSYVNRKFSKWIRNRYSQITNYIDLINSSQSSGSKLLFGKKISKRNGLAIRLMQSESYLINNLIISEFATTYPDSICYTVFDGFLLEENYLNVLLQIIDENGKDYLGFDPKYKININDSTIVDICDMPTTASDEIFESYYQDL